MVRILLADDYKNMQHITGSSIRCDSYVLFFASDGLKAVLDFLDSAATKISNS